jgi:hypothetical protein
VTGRVQGSAAATGLDDDDTEGEPGDNAVPLGEQPGPWLACQGGFAEQSAVLHNLFRQPGVLGRVDGIQPRGADSDGSPAGVESSAMGRCINPACQAADDRHSGAGEAAGELLRHLPAIKRAMPGTDDGDGNPILREQ